MDRAVDKSYFRISRRKAITVLVVAAGLALAVSTLAFERGPFICDNGCNVASPVPDALTLQYIKDSRAPIDYVPMFAWATGTTYQICNASHCTTYHENFEANWVGEGRIPREGGLPIPIDEGVGGGGHGGGGGLPGGGGDIFDNCMASTKPITACTSVDGGKTVCTTHSVPVLDCPP